MTERKEHFVVFREWKTIERETRLRGRKRVVVEVERAWTDRRTFSPSSQTEAILFYKASQRGDWVPAKATWWGVSSPDREIEGAFEGAPVPMPTEVKAQLAAFQHKMAERNQEVKPWSR